MHESLLVCHFSTSNLSIGNLSIFGEFLSHFYPKYLSAVAMATGVCKDERNVDCLVLCHNKQKRKVSAKSVLCASQPYVKIFVVTENCF